MRRKKGSTTQRTFTWCAVTQWTCPLSLTVHVAWFIIAVGSLANDIVLLLNTNLSRFYLEGMQRKSFCVEVLTGPKNQRNISAQIFVAGEYPLHVSWGQFWKKNTQRKRACFSASFCVLILRLFSQAKAAIDNFFPLYKVRQKSEFKTRPKGSFVQYPSRCKKPRKKKTLVWEEQISSPARCCHAQKRKSGFPDAALPGRRCQWPSCVQVPASSRRGQILRQSGGRVPHGPEDVQRRHGVAHVEPDGTHRRQHQHCFCSLLDPIVHSWLKVRIVGFSFSQQAHWFCVRLKGTGDLQRPLLAKKPKTKILGGCFFDRQTHQPLSCWENVERLTLVDRLSGRDSRVNMPVRYHFRFRMNSWCMIVPMTLLSLHPSTIQKQCRVRNLFQRTTPQMGMFLSF